MLNVYKLSAIWIMATKKVPDVKENMFDSNISKDCVDECTQIECTIDLEGINQQIDDYVLTAECCQELQNYLKEYQNLSMASSLLQLAIESKKNW